MIACATPMPWSVLILGVLMIFGLAALIALMVIRIGMRHGC